MHYLAVIYISVNGINVEAIMADYFGQKLPFEAKKPEEFKDAIAVASIIQEMDNLSEEELYAKVLFCQVPEDHIAKHGQEHRLFVWQL